MWKWCSKQKLCYVKQFENQIFHIYMGMIFFLKLEKLHFFFKESNGRFSKFGIFWASSGSWAPTLSMLRRYCHYGEWLVNTLVFRSAMNFKIRPLSFTPLFKKEKKSYFSVLKFKYFSLSLYKALLLKEIKIVYKWLRLSNPPKK